MSQPLPTDRSLYEFLLQVDHDLALKVRSQGCPCGGRLDSAHYLRSPRGLPAGLGDEHRRRLSFCCAREGCRKRTTPPSVRFLGRRVYAGAVMVLVSAMQQGLSARRASMLTGLLNVSRRTLRRWRRWWQDELPASAFWTGLRGLLMPPPDTSSLPSSLLAQFLADGLAGRLYCTLRLLRSAGATGEFGAGYARVR